MVTRTQDSSKIIQTFYGLASNRIFTRMYVSSAWRDWVEIVTAQKLSDSLTNMQKGIDIELTNKINEVKDSIPTQTKVEGIVENDDGIMLQNNGKWKSYGVERNVNGSFGGVQLGIDSQYSNPAVSMHYYLNDVLQSTFEMLVNGEFKLKDNVGNGTTALLFTDNNGTTDKGWIGKYGNGQFTVSASTDDLILDNGYSSSVVVGKGGYLYSSVDGKIALGKSGYRWSNLYTKNITNSSDKNLKENIKYLDSVADSKKDSAITTSDLYKFVKDMKLATFDYKNTGNEVQANQGKLGFIAQDFEGSPIGESILQKNQEDGMLAYDLNNYINVMVGALQQAIKEIETLKEINRLYTQAVIRTQFAGQQISNMSLQILKMQQKITALENKLNNK